MYKEREIEVKINPANFKHYHKINENIKNKETYIFDISNLTKTSSAFISVVCDECGLEKEIKYKYYVKYGFSDGEYYCRKCNSKKKTQEKYGVDNVFQLEVIKEKIKHSIKEKYGVENISQSDEIKRENQILYSNRTFEEREEINKKRQSTLQEKYNIDNISQLLEIKNKKKNTWDKKDETFLNKIKSTRIETLLEKYGVEHTSLITNIKKQQVETYKINTGKRFLNKNNIFIKIEDNNLTGCCHVCNSDFFISKQLFNSRKNNKITYCTKCLPIDSGVSGKELKLLEFIKDNYDGEIIESDRKILNGKELDIYLPELKIAFEFNGIYWHNELNKDKNYHLEKHKKCKEKGINLFHIYEDDWDFRNNIIKSMILNKIGKTINIIYARKTKIVELLDNIIIQKFLNENHLQGYTSSSKKIGLYHNNILISLMIFKKKDTVYELVRFATKLNTSVIGGASKLISYFSKKYDYDRIITFSNNDYSDGKLYEILNFKKTKTLLPDYSYVFEKRRRHKFNFRKNKLKKMGFDISSKTEHKICLENGLFRIYDSGKIKWEIKKEII